MNDPNKNNNWRNTGLYVLLAIVVISLGTAFFSGSSSDNRKEIVYSEFVQRTQSGEVSSVEFTADGARANIMFKDGSTAKVTVPPLDTQLFQILQKSGVTYQIRTDNSNTAWFQVLMTFLFPLLLLGGLFFLLRRAQNGPGNQAMNFGKSKARVQMESQTKTTFQDVAGVDEAKLELAEVVDFLKNRDRFDALGAKIPKGVLLVGPPGTGKTLLAKAVAGEAGVPFFSISGSEFVEMFVGVGASRVRDLFEQAKKNAPCIVFIDEIDAVGRQRGAGLGGGNDEREQTLNQLLVEMDGFEGNGGVIILAATNRPDVLDAALLRPGRFDRQVVVDRPDLKGRLEVLKVHARGKTLARDVDVEKVARRTPGFTGADLANLLNEAAILAARRSLSEISMDEINDAIDRVLAGPEKKNRILGERTKQLIAYHEVGHALLGRLLPNHEPVQKISIIPRGMAAGLTWFTPTDDDMLVSRAQLLDRMVAALGGRVAEELVYGAEEVTTGASNDLERVAAMARTMVTRFGMSEEIGPLALGRGGGGSMFLGRDIMSERDFSEETAQRVDGEVKRFVSESYVKARLILTENRGLLDRVTEELLKRETLDSEELEQVISDYEKRQTSRA
ncbi:ATP-dependent zinc metalloprotease FtsH [Candidatus Cyanaurora vandensis]|uniref:ATP-dependent zinc metalloprotease FtsH n=1 Tax=Candidatus Cyanaurora vandensis TaxID=2714958 RepID=UPI002579CFEA|nr:ATP-dependent zinc metalloprotease FtsH [Candidatus Cyanaurora vandensis]